MKKDQIGSVFTGADVLREHLQRSNKHTKLNCALTIRVVLGKADEHDRS